ncbi:MAG: hypothetical protein ACOH2F_03195, partial [Cellulomonas sp.]
PHSHIQYTRNFHHHEVHRQNLTLTRHTTTADRNTHTGLARVWYQFTTSTGQLLHPPPATARAPAPPDQLDLDFDLDLAHDSLIA